MGEDPFVDYISITEAAEQYKTSRVYWYDMVKAKRIKAYEVPGKRGMYLKKSELKEFWQVREYGADRDDSTA
jgi:excisionase family DNA binding protein